MTDKKLKSLCLSFRRGLIGNRSGEMMCGVVTYPLQGYLSMLGLCVELEEVILSNSNHVFLRLPDGRVLDPTADQFDGPTVYLGEPLWFHKNEELAAS